MVLLSRSSRVCFCPRCAPTPATCEMRLRHGPRAMISSARCLGNEPIIPRPPSLRMDPSATRKITPELIPLLPHLRHHGLSLVCQARGA